MRRKRREGSRQAAIGEESTGKGRGEASIYEPQPAQEKKRELVRTKTLDLKKISVEEALEEMELVDHDFYIFLNEKTGKVNVVYRRTDGNAGLLDLSYAG